MYKREDAIPEEEATLQDKGEETEGGVHEETHHEVTSGYREQDAVDRSVLNRIKAPYGFVVDRRKTKWHNVAKYQSSLKPWY